MQKRYNKYISKTARPHRDDDNIRNTVLGGPAQRKTYSRLLRAREGTAIKTGQ